MAGTKFNDLGITVEARQGRALLWPSLMDQNVSLPELRTHHEALPVEKGIKYGAKSVPLTSIDLDRSE